MNFNSTVKGSLLENFYLAGWDFEKIDACVENEPSKIFERQSYWNANFSPIACDSLTDFEVYMGHEIAMQVRLAISDHPLVRSILLYKTAHP